MLRKLNKNFIFIILALLLTAPAIIGLLHPGFPLTDDGNWMVIRFSAFFQALRSGEFPVRFLMRLNNGYGYPVADFLYPLFMYFSVPIHVLGINFVNTIKVLLILCLFSSSLFTFLWLRKIFDNFSSLIGSALYTLFPYHLYDVYQRGSVGEVLALAILPFILWQMERKSLVWVAIGIAFLIVAHNTLAALFMLLVIPYMLLDILVSKGKVQVGRFYLTSLLLGVGMSAFFWLPAVYDLQYTVFSKTQISNVTNYFANLSLVGWATAFVILSTVIFIVSGLVRIKKHRLAILMFIVSIISIYFASVSSEFLWKILPSSFVQFPFRFLSLTIPSVAFLAACLVSILSKKKRYAMGLAILILVFVAAVSYLIPKIYQDYPDSFYSTNQDTTTVKNEYMPKWVQKAPSQMATAKVQNISGNESIALLQNSPNKTIFSVNLDISKIIQVNTVYFPGWYAYINGQQAQILYNTNGLIDLRLEKGINNVQVVFKETPFRLFSDLVSLSSLAGLVFLILLRKKIRI